MRNDLVAKLCACARPKPGTRSSAWRALAPVLLVALIPKCPICLFGLLAAVGATGLVQVPGMHPRVLLGLSVALLTFVVVWFAVRRGAIGAAVATLAGVAIFAWCTQRPRITASVARPSHPSAVRTQSMQ